MIRLDETLKTGRYFQNNWKRGSKSVSLQHVARAVEFFGGMLVIDWRDR